MDSRPFNILRVSIIVLVIAFFCSGMFWRCATISVAPQGGPKDSLPPKMVGATPNPNAVNVKDKRVYIEFDEYVQLKDQQKEFFTSPFMAKKPALMVKNKGVQIDFKSDLDSNTTYVLNFGQSVTDNNEGNPYVGLTYTFSTGPYIDSLIMSGYVSKAQTSDTVKDAYILFYDAKVDSIPEYDSTIFKSSAIAVGKTIPNGIFIHENLKPIDYKIYALIDNNGNQTYEPGVDDVAFMDSLYNPLHMPSFHLWYDSIMMYRVAEPQVFVKTFRENPPRRNILSSSSRPAQQKIIMKYSADYPVIEKFVIDGVDSAQMIREYAKPTKDSIIYWLNMPLDQLADTLKGHLVYQRHDSVGLLYSHSQDIDFIYKPPFVKKSKKNDVDDKKQEKAPKKAKGKKKRNPGEAIDSAALNNSVDSLQTKPVTDSVVKRPPMKVAVDIKDPLIPTKPIIFDFEMPLTSVNIDGVKLVRTDIKEVKHTAPFTIVRDTMNLRRYILNSSWRAGEKYSLLIPDSAFVNIAGEISDTINKDFTIADVEKYATLTINLQNTDSTSEYIIEILDVKGGVLNEVQHAKAGKTTINYISPGDVMIRVTEDKNHNGVWDTGDIVKRRQPELVAVYESPKDADPLVLTKANWEIEFDIDANQIFIPKYRHVSRKKVVKKEEVKPVNNTQNNNNNTGFGTGFGTGGGSQNFQNGTNRRY